MSSIFSFCFVSSWKALLNTPPGLTNKERDARLAGEDFNIGFILGGLIAPSKATLQKVAATEDRNRRYFFLPPQMLAKAK